MIGTARAGRRGLALAALAILAPACSGGESMPSPVCTSGRAADGTFTLALGGECVKGVTLRVRSGGTFRDAGSDDALAIEDAGSGALRVTASAKAPVEAFAIHIPGVAGDAMLQQGYQSWSFSGALRIPDTITADTDGEPQLGAANAGNVLLEANGVSYGSAVIGTKGGPFLVAGALSAAHATTGITAAKAASGKGADVTILYGANREPLAAGADGKVSSEAIYLAHATDASAGLAGLAAAMKAALPASAIAPKRPPGGWFSWNELFAGVTQDDVLAHVDVVAEKLAPLGMPLVEVDDGWEKAWGDWTSNDKFPGGMEAVGAAITGKGLVAGVWLAPFLVDTTSAPAQSADPSLFLQGDDGMPLVHTPPGLTRTFYVLDGTNPASMAIATEAIKNLRAAGFRFFKLDFLYVGAFPARHTKKDATGNEALASGLAMLREAVGADGFLNACGAPILPVLGVADSLRVGTDTAFSGVTLSWRFITFAGRSLAARAYLSPLVWPDADQAQLRAPYTTDEARTSAAVAALAGPAYALGDDLTMLDPARLALGLDPAVIDLAGAATPGAPDDLFESPAPAVVNTPVFDFTGSAPPPSAWHATGKSGTKYTVTFAWDAPHGVTIAKAK
jgi:alpha-galactosidase